MSAISIIVMVAAAVGMMYGMSKQKSGKSWGRMVAVICAIVALGAAIMNFKSSQPEPISKIIEREQQYQRIAAEKLGKHIASTYNNPKICIICNENSANASTAKNYLAGLKKGLGESATIVKELSPEPDPKLVAEYKKNYGSMPEAEMQENMMPPIEEWYTPEKFDELVKPYMKKCDLIVSVIDLPMDAKGMKFWMEPKAPKLALVSGSIYELQPAFVNQKLVAAVVHNPKTLDNLDEKADPPADLNAAFDKRWLLVTDKNIKDVSTQNPDLFVH